MTNDQYLPLQLATPKKQTPFFLQPEEGGWLNPAVLPEKPDYCCGACVVGAAAAALLAVAAAVAGFSEVAS